MITQERLKELFSYDPETGHFTRLVARKRHPIGSIAGTSNREYIFIKIDGVRYRAHRLVWLYTFGAFPMDEVDHINGDGTDNRYVNLRDATSSENHYNSRISTHNKSGYKGVHWNNREGRWIAQAQCEGKLHYLGMYDKAEEASKAYHKFVEKHHKQYYRKDPEEQK